MHRFVGHLDMHGIAIGIGIDRDGGNPHLARRLDHAAGDLAAIGDQDFREHQRRSPGYSLFLLMGFGTRAQAPCRCVARSASGLPGGGRGA